MQSATYGAASMAIQAEATNSTVGSNGQGIALAHLLEAAIPGGSNIFTGTWDTPPGFTIGAAFTLSGIDQFTPIVDFDVQTGTGASDAVISNLSVVEGGIAIFGVVTNAGITSVPSGHTAIWDNVLIDGGSVETSLSYILNSADGTETSTWTKGTGVWWAFGVSYAPAGAVATPDFDSGPTLDSVTASSITLDYDANADAENVQCMATDTAAAAPTAAAIEAQTGSHGYATEVTTGSADTITVDITDAQVFPLYDVHCMVEEGTSNYSAVVTVSDIAMTAPTGKQFAEITSIGTGSPCEDFNTATNPDIAAGDYLRADNTTTPGSYALTISAACQFIYTGDDSQQTALDTLVYDLSAGDYHADDIDFVSNNHAPVCEEETLVYVFDEDVAIDEIDFNAVCEDEDPSDTLTFAVTAGILPNGLTLSSAGVLSGTPDTEDEAGVAITAEACDQWDDCDTFSPFLYVVNTVTLPNYVGGSLASATSAHAAAFPWQNEELSLIATFSCSDEAANEVISQDPVATTEVTAFDGVSIKVSSGRTCSAIRRRR